MGVVVENETVGRRAGVFVGTTVGIALCVSTKAVLTVETAVCMISASLFVGVAGELLQDASRNAARNKRTRVLPKMLFFTTFNVYKETLNASHLFQRCSTECRGVAVGGRDCALNSFLTQGDM